MKPSPPAPAPKPTDKVEDVLEVASNCDHVIGTSAYIVYVVVKAVVRFLWKFGRGLRAGLRRRTS